MCLICVWHFNPGNILNHGYLGVEFFFILSGYFLAKEAEKEDVTPLKYTWARIKKFFGKYAVALIAMHILIITVHPENIIDNTVRLIPELLFIQNIGPFRGSGLFYPCWFLSVLLFGSCLIIWILKNNKKYSIVFLFLIPLFTFSYLFRVNGSAECWDTVGVFYIPFWRGVAELSLGVLLYKLLPRISIMGGGYCIAPFRISICFILCYHGRFIR